MRAKLQGIKQELRQRMHQPIREQGKWLKQVVGGYFRYHAVPTNSHALQQFWNGVVERWRRQLSRRSQKGYRTWTWIDMLANHWLPQPRILHPWPEQRFAVTTRGRSRM
jgi:RNA-directed DNA polymerase